MMDKIIENNKMPDEYDLAILLTIPFMTDDLEKRKELIFKTYEIASKLNIIDKNILVELKSNQRLLAQHVLDIDELDKFKRGDEMLSEEDLRKLDLYEKEAIKEVARRKFIAKIRGEVREEMRGEVREEVRGEVREEMRGEVREEVKEEVMHEGKVLGEEEVVTKLLKDGFEVEDVLKYTNLNKAHVITLSNSIFLK